MSLPGSTPFDPFARHAAPPAPPRPSSIAERPVVTPRQGPTTRQIANRNFALGLVIGMLLAVAFAGWFIALSDRAAQEDPNGALPRCTDAIADAGGSCYGEPLPECPTEDSTGCYWDGGRNGLGETFTVDESGARIP